MARATCGPSRTAGAYCAPSSASSSAQRRRAARRSPRSSRNCPPEGTVRQAASRPNAVLVRTYVDLTLRHRHPGHVGGERQAEVGTAIDGRAAWLQPDVVATDEIG